jgi:hypothetical protein
LTGNLRRKHSPIRICSNKTKQKSLDLLVLLVRIGTFQSVTANPNKLSRPRLLPFRYALSSWLGLPPLLMLRAADGLAHREHLTGDSDFSKELSEKLRAPAAVHSFERTWA